ncbi:DNA topoisomerase IV subunit A [Azospirillum cavernae]|uniref:DNA topoisomerase 4 subunit A n=1 Tax=Azospirillum cavernae TaxID=2320860 RepID=A0A418W293_9PROT|nr:DNA topoisomerase IV subunit A [Azospirillum cavernae]RJF84152.1 DNA topoisomerase IV subunit A [Azospirillum cavernae]
MKPQDPALDILEKPLADALGERYLSYALSTIMSRSLPDVRDGLKPVHRRLMFAMSQLRLEPTTPPKKCARVVGDVIGKFHPHGDTSVYDALVRLAQDFAVRYPLIDGQGNFGNIDGDNAAAMRYTEARLTEVAKALLDGIDEDAVDFRATYDGDGDEPTVLPANFPNLLANGSSGIAVGMATNIPPHNVGEICDALKHLIKHRDAPIDTLVGFMPGPDFPTGGVMVESRESVVESYRTGRGSFRLRARWTVEKLPQGTWQIVVTEMPYQVPKARLVEKVAELLTAKKLILLEDIRDESAEDVRLVLVPKSRNVDPEVLMASLFQATDLEIRFSLNMNVLGADHVPRVMNLREVLQAFLDHRHEVLVRRSRYRLAQIEHRLEILSGYLIAYLNLDEVIRIIREEDEPKQDLMRVFALTDVQADAILNMRLRNLRKLEEMEIRREHDALTTEKNGLTELLGDEALRWKRITDGVAEIKKKFGGGALGKRRTDIADAPALIDVPLEAMVEREPVTVICSKMGWIRSVRGHLTDADQEDVKYKDGDSRGFVIPCETTDKLLVFASNGKFFTLGVDKLPRGRGFGEPIRLMIDLGNDVDIVDLFRHQPGRKLLVASDDGRGFQVEEVEVLAQTRSGKQVLNLEDGRSARICHPLTGDHLAVIGNNRKLVIFPLIQVPLMTRGKGVQLQKYKDASVADVKSFALADGLTWKHGERVFTVTDLTGWLDDRAGVGKMPPNGFPKQNRFT